MAFQAGVENCGVNFNGANDSDWSLLMPEYIIGLGTIRTWQRQVTFPTQFSEVPVVALSPISMDIALGLPKYQVIALDVEATGFMLFVGCWGDCMIRGISVQWLAYDSESAL